MLKNLKSKWKDDLYRNSIYLMINTAILSGFGFVFWTIAARLFNTNEVGLATTIISAFNLIITLSGFGLGTALIRFLPKSKIKNKKINSSYSISMIIAIAISAIFLLFLKYFSPDLVFIQKNLYYSLFFIVGVIVGVWGNITDSVFLSYKSSQYTLLENTIFSILKILFLFLFVFLLSYGIFLSWILALLLSLSVSLIILVKKFKYKFKFVFYDSIIKKIFNFSFSNYLAGLIKIIPSFILPLIITFKLTPVDTAYFYIALNIAGLLYIITGSISSSLFAKASSQEQNLNKIMKKSIFFSLILLIPGMILFLLFDKYLLLLFGQEYSTNALTILNFLILSAPFLAINSLYSSYLNVKKRLKKLILMNLVISISVIVLVTYFLDRGLYGVGLGYLIAQALVLLFILFK